MKYTVSRVIQLAISCVGQVGGLHIGCLSLPSDMTHRSISKSAPKATGVQDLCCLGYSNKRRV